MPFVYLFIDGQKSLTEFTLYREAMDVATLRAFLNKNLDTKVQGSGKAENVGKAGNAKKDEEATTGKGAGYEAKPDL